MFCVLCDSEKDFNVRGFAQHLMTMHKETTREEYYLEHVDSRSTCMDCDAKLKFRGFTDGYAERCAKCRTKKSWENDVDRREKLSERLTETPMIGGRRKGSKNKNPYPESARILRSQQFKGREAPYNRCPIKINKQKETWQNKPEEEIAEMMRKQLSTRMENGTETVYHQGKYKPKNTSKYKGDINAITYRSSWEKAVLIWCDSNPKIVVWNSEEIIVPYIWDVDKKQHRYFVDFFIQFSDGRKVVVEIKPAKETVVPRKGKDQSRYITESLTYVKNQNKWDAARKFCASRGYEFEVWTEHTLRAMGILKTPIKTIKPLRKKRVTKK